MATNLAQIRGARGIVAPRQTPGRKAPLDPYKLPEDPTQRPGWPQPQQDPAIENALRQVQAQRAYRTGSARDLMEWNAANRTDRSSGIIDPYRVPMAGASGDSAAGPKQFVSLGPLPTATGTGGGQPAKPQVGQYDPNTGTYLMRGPDGQLHWLNPTKPPPWWAGGAGGPGTPIGGAGGAGTGGAGGGTGAGTGGKFDFQSSLDNLLNQLRQDYQNQMRDLTAGSGQRQSDLASQLAARGILNSGFGANTLANANTQLARNLGAVGNQQLTTLANAGFQGLQAGAQNDLARQQLGYQYAALGQQGALAQQGQMAELYGLGGAGAVGEFRGLMGGGYGYPVAPGGSYGAYGAPGATQTAGMGFGTAQAAGGGYGVPMAGPSGGFMGTAGFQQQQLALEQSRLAEGARQFNVSSALQASQQAQQQSQFQASQAQDLAIQSLNLAFQAGQQESQQQFQGQQTQLSQQFQGQQSELERQSQMSRLQFESESNSMQQEANRKLQATLAELDAKLKINQLDRNDYNVGRELAFKQHELETGNALKLSTLQEQIAEFQAKQGLAERGQSEQERSARASEQLTLQKYGLEAAQFLQGVEEFRQKYGLEERQQGVREQELGLAAQHQAVTDLFPSITGRYAVATLEPGLKYMEQQKADIDPWWLDPTWAGPSAGMWVRR